MTDGEAFLLVFVLIYLSDCLVWLTPAGYALVSFWGRGYLVRRARVSFEALKKGFAVLNPLPPFGTLYVGEAWPVALTAEGLAPWSRENPNPGAALGGLRGVEYTPWDRVERVSARDGYLCLNGRRFAHCATRASAGRLARAVEKIRLLPDADARDEAIARLVRRSFNARHAARRAAFFHRVTRSLRFNAILLWVLVFFLLPYAYWRLEDGPRFYLVLLGVWLLMWWIAIEFVRLHRRFYPRISGDRWQHFVFALCFPHYAIRSIDALSKGFLAGHHPLAIAVALARPEERDRLAGNLSRDARFPIPLGEGGDAPSARAAEVFRQRYFLPALESLMTRSVEDDEDTPTTVAWCPRCHTPYEVSGIPCDDCGGIPTVARPQAH